MTRDTCDGCGRDVITSDADTESFCPDCAGGPSHGPAYQRRQGEALDAGYYRQRVIDNAAVQGGEL